MRDSTADWLAPMLDAAENRPDIDINTLMSQATMPAAEADNKFFDWRAKNAPALGHRGLEWIRFGQLLRHELGWDETYPDHPAVLN